MSDAQYVADDGDDGRGDDDAHDGLDHGRGGGQAHGLGAAAASRDSGVDEYFYLDMLARTGIVGLLLYILPFGYVVVWCLRRRSLLRECPEGAAVVCGLCTFWIVTWFNPWMNAVLGIAWYAVTLSVPQALEEQNA